MKNAVMVECLLMYFGSVISPQFLLSIISFVEQLAIKRETQIMCAFSQEGSATSRGACMFPHTVLLPFPPNTTSKRKSNQNAEHKDRDY